MCIGKLMLLRTLSILNEYPSLWCFASHLQLKHHNRVTRSSHDSEPQNVQTRLHIVVSIVSQFIMVNYEERLMNVRT